MPSVSLRMLRLVIAYTDSKPLSLAVLKPAVTIRSQPFLVVFLMAIAESSLILNSMPAYSPSVAWHTNKVKLSFLILVRLNRPNIGVKLEFLSDAYCDAARALGTGRVVVGPLKQASDSSSSFHTSGEI